MVTVAGSVGLNESWRYRLLGDRGIAVRLSWRSLRIAVRQETTIAVTEARSGPGPSGSRRWRSHPLGRGRIVLGGLPERHITLSLGGGTSMAGEQKPWTGEGRAPDGSSMWGSACWHPANRSRPGFGNCASRIPRPLWLGNPQYAMLAIGLNPWLSAGPI